MASPVSRPTRPPQSPGGWSQMADQYRAINLDARADQITAMLNKVEQLDTSTTQLSADLDATTLRCVFGVINGGSVLDMALELDAARRVASSAGTVPELIALVRSQLYYDLAKEFWTVGERLIAELDDVVQLAAERITDARGKVGDIDNDAKAVRAKPAAQAAWSLMLTEVDRIATAHHIANTLRLRAFVANLTAADPTDWTWRHPEKLGHFDAREHPALALARHIDNGAGPCCATADEVWAALYAA